MQAVSVVQNWIVAVLNENDHGYVIRNQVRETHSSIAITERLNIPHMYQQQQKKHGLST